jgi:hypothetical protein
MTDKESLAKLTELHTAHDVAALFGMSYAQLAKAIYKKKGHPYRTFEIKKKNGGHREINAPHRIVKEIQRQLAQILQNVYDPRPSVHGFIPGRSIVTNAAKHQNKAFLFNIDLKEFFATLTFGRVRRMFQSKPFEIPLAPATVLAQICCYAGRLPQGAPTSPVLANIICKKLDGALQRLAREHRATYTRYADDITFSFTCGKRKLPNAIVKVAEDEVASVGHDLAAQLESNGFVVNESKVRLRGRSQRQEATGLVVNRFVNVPRVFVRRTSSMIYAWEKFGLASASDELYAKYTELLSERASTSQPSFENILKGRLAYLHMVRGRADPIYAKLAQRFNALATKTENRLPLVVATDSADKLSDAVLVIESLYDDADGNHVSQGTGFYLAGVGFITAAHVVTTDAGTALEEIWAHTYKQPTDKFRLTVRKFDLQRDLAICDLTHSDGSPYQALSWLEPQYISPKQGADLELVGFGNYKLGQNIYVEGCHAASHYPYLGFRRMEITAQIRAGNSGGPVLNSARKVVGVAVEGAHKAGGNNSVVLLGELQALLGE